MNGKCFLKAYAMHQQYFKVSPHAAYYDALDSLIAVYLDSNFILMSDLQEYLQHLHWVFKDL